MPQETLRNDDGTYLEVPYPEVNAPLIPLGTILCVMSVTMGVTLMTTKGFPEGLDALLIGAGWGLIALSKFRRLMYLGATGSAAIVAGYSVGLTSDDGIQVGLDWIGIIVFGFMAASMSIPVIGNYFVRRYNAKVLENIYIEDVEILDLYSVEVTLSNGTSKVVDLEPLLLGKRYAETRDNFFCPKVTKRGVEWPGGFTLTTGDVL